jgi:hypothetical protein
MIQFPEEDIIEFPTLIKYLYYESIDLNLQNAFPLLYLSRKLVIENLKLLIQEFLYDCMEF